MGDLYSKKAFFALAKESLSFGPSLRTPQIECKCIGPVINLSPNFES